MPVTSPRLLLCEGLQSLFIPSVRYVRQKGKVFFFEGQKSLCESIGSDQIVESIDKLELYEKKNDDGSIEKVVKDGVYVVEGPFQRSDVKNANQRTYGRKIWERLVADDKSPVQELCKARGMIGHLEHPKDGRTDGNEGALVITSLKLLTEKGENDGVVWGAAELLDTPKGKVLQEYTRKKVRWGVSSRGNGSVDENGVVNEKDFMVETWDAVMRPSTPGAYPTQVETGKGGKALGTDESVDTVSMTEDAITFASDVETLCATSVEGLNESEMVKLAGQFLSVFGQSEALTRAKKLPFEKADSIRDAVMATMRKLTERAEALAESEESSPEAENEFKRREAAFDRVVEAMQNRLEKLAQEAEIARQQLVEKDAELEKTREDLAAYSTAVEESNVRCNDLQTQLDLASNLIATNSKVELNDPVKDAVDDAIKHVPGLAAFRETLETADNPAHVEELAESLLPQVVAKRPLNENRNPIVREPLREKVTRRTLPQGQVFSKVVENSDETYSELVENALSEDTKTRVSLAALAVKSMKSRSGN